VFAALPGGVTVANPTGVTASGRPFITVNVAGLPRDAPVLRVQFLIRNASLNVPSTFFLGFTVRTFAGPFDPTQV
jgi:hypothetical protein